MQSPLDHTTMPSPVSESRRPGTLPPVVRLPHLVWGLAAGVLMALGSFGAGLLAGLIIGTAGAVLVGVLIGGAVLGWGTLWYGLMHRHGWSWADLGFRRPRRSLLHLLWILPASIIVAATAAALIGPLLDLSPGEASPMESDIMTLPGAFAIPVLLMAVVVMPAFEEILFRRLLLDWLAAHLPLAVAAVLVIAVFAGIHVSPPAVLYILFFGTALTALTSFMADRGAAEQAGLLYGVMGVGSAVLALGVVWLPPRFTLHARWIVFATILVAGSVLFAIADSVTAMTIALALVGIGVGPTIVTQYSLGAARSPRGRSATVMTMLGSGVVVGQAVASAGTGAIAESAGTTVALVLPLIAAAIVLIAGIANRLISPVQR